MKGMKGYSKKGGGNSMSRSGKKSAGAGLGWGATGPGGTSRSKPTKKGPYHPK